MIRSVLGRLFGANSARIRDVAGNVIVGDVNGMVI